MKNDVHDHDQQGLVNVAFQGEHGAFSEDAARRLFAKAIQTLPCRSFEDLFDSVTSGKADCAVVPIENTLAGSVHKNYDLLLQHQLTILAEINLRIVHNLIALRGSLLSQIKRVYSHPVALAQCERFLRRHNEMEASAAYDTAGSVKMIVEAGRVDEAAIAGAAAAQFYDAEVLLEGIEDNKKNFTRFLVLATAQNAQFVAAQLTADSQNQPRKTSLVFRISNRPGALFRALAVFALRDIDLLKIESRPIEGRPWEYSFYLDIAGDSADPNIQRATGHLQEMTESVRVLGSYPGSEPSPGLAGDPVGQTTVHQIEKEMQ
ncbi:MAG TPA: prephenate dehydratase [Blastocatellia bacterium]|nr:prephenate dehydratase [Blastocatellia bacterium]